MAEIRGLSIQQPWAWAIAAAGKDVENRSWPTPYRGLLAIHASKTFDEGALMPDPEALSLFMNAVAEDIRTGVPALARGAVVAVAVLVGCHNEVTEEPRNSCAPWAIRGQYHWMLSRVRPLAVPVPCRGALGLWHLPDEVEQAVRELSAVSR